MFDYHRIRGSSLMVNASLQISNDGEREWLYRKTINLIGDPADSIKWIPWPGATDQEKKQLKHAQHILNEWLNGQYLDVFFEKITMDQSRKRFWKSYISNISYLKIYGKPHHLRKLKFDERIKDYIENRFGELIDGESICALCFWMRDRLFIEFSKNGNALYALRTISFPS